MNNQKSGFSEMVKGKTKDIWILLVVGLLLSIALWAAFKPSSSSAALSYEMGDDEERLSYLLSRMDGVGEAEVVICETDAGIKNVFVLCEGANDFEVVINVREAVAAAIGTDARNVKIYLKK